MAGRALIWALAAVLAALAASPASARRTAAASPSGALFLIRGHGWGHGVGMSQWGAQGYAEHAYTYQQILAAYYPGTTLETQPTTRIRVLLASGRKSLTLSSDQPITVTDGAGAAHTLPAGTTKLTPALQLAVDGGAAQPLTPPLTFAPASGSSLTLGRPYRGTITVDLVGNRLEAVNTLPLEQYLAGVVPSEMPSTWLPAALETQAVASRTYALATRRVGADFDVYADTRSQAYGGIDAERPTATAAVAATAGQVLFYGSSLATTFFSSSSGGRTQTPADAWGGEDVPYLPSRPDPYDSISPYHDWGPIPVPAQTLARALGVGGRVVDATTSVNSSLRVAQLDLRTVVSGAARTTPVPGSSVAAALGLRSTWFRVSVLSLQPPLPNPAVPAGAKVSLTGVLRGAAGAVVQQRTAGGQWTALRKPRPGRGQTFTIAVRPTATTWYRVAVPGAASPPIRIRVAAG
jgi:stage II sporulation protein D